MDVCPECGREVFLTAVENPRNGKWTVLPLEDASDPELDADFKVLADTHEAVDIMGQVVGEFPVAVYTGERSTETLFRTHNPSHYLHQPYHEDEDKS
jgi:hypothetical protein